MVRNIVGVILGYVLMSLTIFLTFTAAYLLMGADNAFRPGIYEVSLLWIVVSFVLAFAAAVLGGYVCAAIAGSRKAPLALAMLVLFIALLAAVPALRAAGNGEEPPRRSGEVSNMEAMQKCVQPAWIALLNPFAGAAAILVGASLRRRRQD